MQNVGHCDISRVMLGQPNGTLSASTFKNEVLREMFACKMEDVLTVCFMMRRFEVVPFTAHKIQTNCMGGECRTYEID